MPSIILSGWGQAADALLPVAPHAQAIDYAAHAPGEAGLLALADHASAYDTVIGWSMGGHMAVQAIARGWVRPKKLVLIATPFQFVRTPSLALGMGIPTYQLFRDNYAADPKRTLKRAHLLVAKDDSNANDVIAYAHASRERLKPHDWLGWLDWLGQSSCAGLDFAHFPPTLILHGKQDAVVSADQASYFAQRLPHANVHIFPHCGHAPHWHDASSTRALIEDFIHV